MVSVPELLMAPPRSSPVHPVMLTSVRFVVPVFSMPPPLPPQPPFRVPFLMLSVAPLRTVMTWPPVFHSRAVSPRSSVWPLRSMVTVLPSAIFSVLLLRSMFAVTVMFAPSFAIAARSLLSSSTSMSSAQACPPTPPRGRHSKARKRKKCFFILLYFLLYYI